jgi:arginase
MAGDCTVSIGVLAGLQRDVADFSLVWYDAHGDVNSPETKPSGFIGGMPLAMLCGRGDQTIVTGAGAKILPEMDIVLTDARDLDPGEADAVAESAVKHLPDVADLLSLDLSDRPHLSAVSYPADGGPSLETIEASLDRLASTNRIAAISVSMWNPDMDQDNRAENLVVDLVERLLA